MTTVVNKLTMRRLAYLSSYNPQYYACSDRHSMWVSDNTIDRCYEVSLAGGKYSRQRYEPYRVDKKTGEITGRISSKHLMRIVRAAHNNKKGGA